MMHADIKTLNIHVIFRMSDDGSQNMSIAGRKTASTIRNKFTDSYLDILDNLTDNRTDEVTL